jgi:4-diphosphocytidyl-2-C-methyl-D-erythritol kinase
MRGIGEILSAPLRLPRLHALLVNPGVAVPTKPVFSRWKPSANPIRASDTAADFAGLPNMRSEKELFHWLASEANDLEAPAIALAPVIAEVLASLRAAAGCRLARMSGSGATCFALFSSAADRASAGNSLRAKSPAWWIAETMLA